MSEEIRIIEVNGVKLEVDMRYAKRIDHLRVGSKVKVLAKGQYNGPKVYPGVVVGFEPFDDLPTIIVAYIEGGYTSCELKFAYINSGSIEKWDVVASVDDEIPVKRKDVLASFKRQEEKALAEVKDIQLKREYFLRHFDQYFPETEESAVA